MLQIITLAALATINCISYAHAGHGEFPPEHPSDHPEHPSDHPEHPSEETTTDEDSSSVQKQVIALLTEVHKAYKEAEGITETLTLTFPTPMGEAETMTVSLIVGEDSGSVVAEEQATFVWKEGKIYGSISEIKDAYVEGDAPDGFYAGLTSMTEGGGGGVPSWSLALRESNDFNAWIESFNLFGIPGMEVSAVESKEVDGAKVEVIILSGPAGRFEITVNNVNKVESVIAYIVQPGMPEVVIPILAETSFAKATSQISFDVGDKKKYDSIEEMFIANMPEMPGAGGEGPPESKLTGSTAPDFTLERMDGSGKVTLSDLKGQVVILDFWATWCGPCKRGLPGLNKLDEWVQAEGLNAQIFAVNVWEEGQSDKVKKFWADNKYSTKVLMGSADKKLTDNYQISGIPMTAVIGTDGNIIEIHSGFAPGMDEMLKKSILEALGKSVLKVEGDDAKPENPKQPSDHPSDHPN